MYLLAVRSDPNLEVRAHPAVGYVYMRRTHETAPRECNADSKGVHVLGSDAEGLGKAASGER